MGVVVFEVDSDSVMGLFFKALGVMIGGIAVLKFGGRGNGKEGDLSIDGGYLNCAVLFCCPVFAFTFIVSPTQPLHPKPG